MHCHGGISSPGMIQTRPIGKRQPRPRVLQVRAPSGDSGCVLKCTGTSRRTQAGTVLDPTVPGGDYLLCSAGTVRAACSADTHASQHRDPDVAICAHEGGVRCRPRLSCASLADTKEPGQSPGLSYVYQQQ